LTTKENSFTVWYPTGWGAPSSSGSSGSYVMVDVKPTKLCCVAIDGNTKAGTIGDAAAAAERAALGASGSGHASLPVERTADGALLEFFKKAGNWAAQRPEFAGNRPEFAYNFANVRSAWQEYSYTKHVGLMPVKMKGERWTSFQRDYGYHVYAEAPKQALGQVQGHGGTDRGVGCSSGPQARGGS